MQTVAGYANGHNQFQKVIDRKLFGTTTLINDFIQKLTKTETVDGGWATKYIDDTTGKQWLNYVADDRNFFENLMLISPEPTTDELIEIAFSSNHPDEVYAAATRLNIEERTEKKEYRQKLIDRLNTIDISKINRIEKEKIKTIILASQLANRVNKRETLGKYFTEIKLDADFFNKVAEKTEDILKLL